MSVSRGRDGLMHPHTSLDVMFLRGLSISEKNNSLFQIHYVAELKYSMNAACHLKINTNYI